MKSRTPSRKKIFFESLQKLNPYSSRRAIQVFSRHCCRSEVSSNKKRSEYFSREKCYKNLIATVDDRVDVVFLVDTFYGNLKDHFLANEKKYPVVEFKVGSEAGSFLKMLEYVESRRFSPQTILYFVEDDYVHRPGWVDVLLEAFSLEWASYATLYDHKDKYFLPIYEELSSRIFHTFSTHWRTTPSTTNTYAMLWKTLKEHLPIHKTYSEGRTATDCHNKFLKLKEMGAILISPVPGWSTHSKEEYESPCIDWEKILSFTINSNFQKEQL
jgi:hypothetical protein